MKESWWFIYIILVYRSRRNRVGYHPYNTVEEGSRNNGRHNRNKSTRMLFHGIKGMEFILDPRILNSRNAADVNVTAAGG